MEFKDNNHSLIQLPLFALDMKRFLALSVLALILACEPEKNSGGNKEEVSEPEVMVDLGIVMTRKDGTTYKLYWATSNLCESGLCKNPQDYGDYYAWGETEPHYVKGHAQDNPCTNWRSSTNPAITGYNWESYKWCNGSYPNMTKYNTNSSYGPVDSITELQCGEKEGETNDDAARAVLGGKWRIPTDEEWTALCEQCSWEWTADYNGTGVAGRIVTSNVDGFKGKSIFLPAAGSWWYDEHLSYAGTDGNYWSSSLYTADSTFACDVGFDYDQVGRSCLFREIGLPVRPVTEGQ